MCVERECAGVLYQEHVLLLLLHIHPASLPRQLVGNKLLEAQPHHGGCRGGEAAHPHQGGAGGPDQRRRTVYTQQRLLHKRQQRVD